MPGHSGLVKVDARLRRGGGVLHVEQVQPVGPVVVRPGDGHVPQHRPQLEPAKGDRKTRPRGDQPALRLDPGIGGLPLLVVREALMEKSIVVIEAHAVPLEAQGGDGVQEAGRQAAQPAVAQGGLRLLFLHRVQVPAPAGQQLPHLLPDAQGEQVVVQQLPHQELRGEVVELPLPLRGGPPGRLTARQDEQRLIQLTVAALLRGKVKALPDDLYQFFFQIHV